MCKENVLISVVRKQTTMSSVHQNPYKTRRTIRRILLLSYFFVHERQEGSEKTVPSRLADKKTAIEMLKRLFCILSFISSSENGVFA